MVQVPKVKEWQHSAGEAPIEPRIAKPRLMIFEKRRQPRARASSRPRLDQMILTRNDHHRRWGRRVRAERVCAERSGSLPLRSSGHSYRYRVSSRSTPRMIRRPRIPPTPTSFIPIPINRVRIRESGPAILSSDTPTTPSPHDPSKPRSTSRPSHPSRPLLFPLTHQPSLHPPQHPQITLIHEETPFFHHL